MTTATATTTSITTDFDDNMEDEDCQLWVCEFCGGKNLGDFEEVDLPTTDERDYMLEPPSQEDSKKHTSGSVIFVVDVSGSMCVTTEVPGTFKLKGVNQRSSEFNNLPDIPGRSVRAPLKKVTYVSRLQCLQASISQQLDTWAKEVPDKYVGLVTFNNSVTIIGDGSNEPEVVSGDKLEDHELLQAIGKKHELKNCIRESQKILSEKIWSLEETGPTALGPALLLAVSMAQNSKGSKVIVCTDGLANVGLGALDAIANEEQRKEVEQWYEGVGNLAKINGVTVDVISIKGSECALEDLGQVSEIAGGEVIRMDPLELTKNFSTILANPVIASQVSCTFFLHEGLSFRNQAGVGPNDHKVTREMGNVTASSEIFFEYEVNPGKVNKHKGLKSLPFQVQIRYTKLNGMKCMRVLSQSQLITTKRRVAEEDVRMDLLASNVAYQSANMAEQGNYEQARMNNVRCGRMMQRSANTSAQKSVYRNWAKEMNDFDGSCQTQSTQLKSRMKASSRRTRDNPYEMARSMRNDSAYEEIRSFKGKSSKYWGR